MRSLRVFGLVVLIVMAKPAFGAAQTCSSPPLSEQQLREIIARERASRTDLPPAFPEAKVSVSRQGCYYVYMEWAVPQVPDNNHIFKLNQRGVIVDVQLGTSPSSSMQCPERQFTAGELAEIVRNERAKRRDLPPPFPNSRTVVNRVRCLYMYYEYAVPESRGNFQVFTIDPYGEVMEVTRPHPY